MTAMTPKEGEIWHLDILKGNRYRIMAIRLDGRYKRQVIFTNVKTGKTGNLELKEFMKNFKQEIK